MLPPAANAELVSANPPDGGPPGSPPPANLSRTITLSIVFGVPPLLSLLVEVSHRPPSGVWMTVRSRPQRPLKNARGLSVVLPLICMTHRREPRIAAMYSQSFTISSPLGEAAATSHCWT